MNKKLDLDSFGDIVDKFLEENEVEMLLTVPKGTQIYILLNSIGAICKELRTLLGIDTASPEWEHTVDVMLGMVKREILTEDED